MVLVRLTACCLSMSPACRKYVKLHTTVKGYSAQHTQDTGTQCNTDEGNTGVIKKRSKRVESFSSFENPSLFIGININ
jgi:hypothetical protein